MNTFRWEGVNNPKVWLDNQHLRTLSVVRARHVYTRLAEQLLAEDNVERAAEVLNRALELFPAPRVPFDYFSLLQAEALYQAEMIDRANTELTAYAEQLLSELDYFHSLKPAFFNSVQQKAEMNMELLRRIMDVSDAHGQNQISEYIRQNFKHEQSLSQ